MTRTTQQLCSSSKKACAIPCPAYGAQSFCPPLIVIAVLAAHQGVCA